VPDSINIVHQSSLNVYDPLKIELSVKYSKESTKTLCLLKLGIKWLKWGEYIVKIEDNNSRRWGQQYKANWVPLNG
jgi:hypothetical protein